MSRGTPPAIRCERDGALARVVIDNPLRHNAMTRAMWRELKGVFEGLHDDPGLRCVVLQGQGGHFCAGGDISEYPGFRFTPDGLRLFHEDEVWGCLSAILRCDVPVIAAIRGNCMGAGVELASCCDLRLATADARFGAPIGKLGFPMAPREARLVATALGDATARALLLAAHVLPASRLCAQGFLLDAVAPEALDQQVQALVQQVLHLGPQAARLNKRTLRALADAPLSDELLAGAYGYADSAEHREGIGAFLDKRPARF